MTKKPRQKLKYPENEKSFWGEIKTIFHHFSRASSCQKLCQTLECSLRQRWNSRCDRPFSCHILGYFRRVLIYFGKRKKIWFRKADISVFVLRSLIFWLLLNLIIAMLTFFRESHWQSVCERNQKIGYCSTGLFNPWYLELSYLTCKGCWLIPRKVWNITNQERFFWRKNISRLGKESFLIRKHFQIERYWHFLIGK